LRGPTGITNAALDEQIKIANANNKNTFRDGNSVERVVFEASPTLGESRSVEYVDQGLPGPVGIVVYRVTQNRRFSLSVKIVSRTVAEAQENYKYVNLLRSWLVPQESNVGEDVSEDSGDKSAFRGRPPILRLSGYRNQFHNIPVVISELSITYPEDVDYIETDIATVPIIQSIEISLIEAHGRSTNALTSDDAKKAVSGRLSADFDINLYKAGTLPGY